MSILLKKKRSLALPPPAEDHQINLFRGQDRRGYGRAFWLAYVSNFLISVAVSILYRYADFVRLLGGSEYQLGWIVGVGMVGSLTARLALGSGIDRRGPKLVWLVSQAAFCGICFAHLGLTRPDTPAIYLLRIAYCLAVAGVFGAAMTFVSGRLPVVRMAEMIGMLGTAGFTGMVVGAQVGDWLCGAAELSRADVDRLFVAAGLIGLIAMLFAGLATSRSLPPKIRRRQPPMGYLLWRYQPGAILAVALIAGIGLGWPSTFVATYAAELGIPRLGAFFTLYSITAVITRVVTRRWPAQMGLQPLVVASLGIIAASQFLFLLVHNEWTLMLPGLTYGIGHAILFPTVVATGCRTFPKRYRGLGTMLIMSAFDLGTMVGSPLVGAVIHHAPDLGLPGYPTLFVLMGVLLTGTTLFYGLLGHREATPSLASRSGGVKRIRWASGRGAKAPISGGADGLPVASPAAPIAHRFQDSAGSTVLPEAFPAAQVSNGLEDLAGSTLPSVALRSSVPPAIAHPAISSKTLSSEAQAELLRSDSVKPKSTCQPTEKPSPQQPIPQAG